MNKKVHIKIPAYLKRRLDKIKKDTGKQMEAISKEILSIGIKKYYEVKKNGKD